MEGLGFAFVAAGELAVALKPGQASFDGPAVAAQALRTLDRLAGDPHGDPTPADLCPQGRNVIMPGPRGVWPGGAEAVPAGADRGDRVQQCHHDLPVVDVRGRDQTAQRNPDRSQLTWIFDPGCRGRSGSDRSRAPFSARTEIESTIALDQSISPANAELVQELVM